MKAIRLHAYGGPEALRLEELPRPEPGPGQALVRIEAAGVNFIEVYQRRGLYPVALPVTPGGEGAGTVVSIGEGVTALAPGDRVASVNLAGAYARYAVAPAERLIRLPDGVTTRQGAAAMLQGMTAHYLACSTYPLKSGDTCVVHAAAGGVGLLLCQIAKRRGARVIGTVSTGAKAALARQAGADEVILYAEQDFEAEVKRLTGGRGAQVVYDSVGLTTFDRSLRSLAPRGTLALFGQSSGPVPPFDRRRSTSTARCSSRARAWGTTSPRARSWYRARARCSAGSATARCGCAWTANSRWPRRRTPIARSSPARRPASCCSFRRTERRARGIAAAAGRLSAGTGYRRRWSRRATRAGRRAAPEPPRRRAATRAPARRRWAGAAEPPGPRRRSRLPAGRRLRSLEPRRLRSPRPAAGGPRYQRGGCANPNSPRSRSQSRSRVPRGTMPSARRPEAYS